MMEMIGDEFFDKNWPQRTRISGKWTSHITL
jgi:hypothetical protein